MLLWRQIEHYGKFCVSGTIVYAFTTIATSKRWRLSFAFVDNHLQPILQLPPVRQERMRISHTMSQELHPLKPVLPPHPKQLRSMMSNTISQVLHPQPFVPFVKKPFILCTSSFIGFYSYITLRNRFNLCYSSLIIACANILCCGLFEANDRYGYRSVLHIDCVGTLFDLLQFGFKVVDCARKTGVCTVGRVVYAVCLSCVSILGFVHISSGGAQKIFSSNGDFYICRHWCGVVCFCVFHT